jgi:iron complex transport system substrate-binding protein
MGLQARRWKGETAFRVASVELTPGEIQQQQLNVHQARRKTGLETRPTEILCSCRVLIGVLGTLTLLASLGCDSEFGEGTRESRLRIVSLAPSVTEMLFALGVEDSIVGVTDQCDYPPQAKDIECLGGFGAPNLETLLALSPDLVIATGVERADATQVLQQAGIRVLWLKTGDIAQILDALQEIGRQVGRRERAAELVAAIQTELETIAAEHRHTPVDQRPRVFVEVWNHPITTAGRGSYVDELIQRAGGINVAHELDAAYPTVNPEKVVEWNPDVIVLGYMNAEPPKEVLAHRIGWQDLAAVRSGNIIHDISPDLLLRPGPRLAQGVGALSRRLHRPAERENVEP